MENEDNGTTTAGTAPTEARLDRRRALKVGALLVPTILTLHAAPAWASTDYTLTAYRYGANAGRCRNPSYDPNADPSSTAGQEFIDCPLGTGSGQPTHEVDTTGQTDTRDFLRM